MTSPNRGIKVQIGGKAGNLCQVGRTILAAVVDRIRTDPPKYPGKPGTLIQVDPCAQLSDADVSAVLGGGGAKVTPTNLHWCTWRRDSAEIWVWLRLGVDPVRTADETKIQKVDVGVPAVQEADTGSGAKRSVEWSHLALAGSNAEVVNATCIRYDTQQREDACAMARGVAKTLVPKLPKS